MDSEGLQQTRLLANKYKEAMTRVLYYIMGLKMRSKGSGTRPPRNNNAGPGNYYFLAGFVKCDKVETLSHNGVCHYDFNYKQASCAVNSEIPAQTPKHPEPQPRGNGRESEGAEEERRGR